MPRSRRPHPALLAPLRHRLGRGGDPRPRPLRPLVGRRGLPGGPGAPGGRGVARPELALRRPLGLRHRPGLPGHRRAGRLRRRRRPRRPLRGRPDAARRGAPLADGPLGRGARPEGPGAGGGLPVLRARGVAAKRARGARELERFAREQSAGSTTTPSSSPSTTRSWAGGAGSEWPAPLRDREPGALADARAR